MVVIASKKCTQVTTSLRKIVTTFSLGFILLNLSGIMVVTDPIISLTRYMLRLGNGTLMHEMLSQEMRGVHVRAYIFNATNADRFLAGEDDKLKVEEVGPFTYEEIRLHGDIEIDPEAEVMRYTPTLKLEFIPELSIAHPEDVQVVVPNLAMLAITTMLSSYPQWIQYMYNMYTNQLNSKPFITLDASSYFMGYTDPLVKMANVLVPGMIYFDSIGLMDRLYDKDAGYRLEVSTTQEEKYNIKNVKKFKIGDKEHMWEFVDPSNPNNSFVNTYEGLGYPPNINPETPLRVFRVGLCRVIDLDYVETMTTDLGFDSMVHTFSNRSLIGQPGEDGLCDGKRCMNGIGDLSNCFFGIPLGMSKAHFLDVDPKLVEQIEGMTPNEEEHNTRIYIEPKLGISLSTMLSIQMNIVLNDVSFSTKASRLSNMVLPIGHFKFTQPELPDDAKHNLKMALTVSPYILIAVEIIFFITGLALITYSIRLLRLRLNYNAKRSIILTDSRNSDTSKLSVEKPLIKDLS